jgi:hypothetical protein
MTEGLAAQISSIVRQHLADAHRMLGTLLAQLDAAGEVDLGGRAPTEAIKPAIAAPSAKLSTIERKLRRQRAKQRQAANGEAALAPKPGGPWPALRSEFHAAIKTRHLSRAEVAAELHVSKGSICGWPLPHGAPPSAGNISKIRRWLSSAPRPVRRRRPPSTIGRRCASSCGPSSAIAD